MIRTSARHIALCLALSPLVAQGQGLEFPANARLVHEEIVDPGSYALPTGPWNGALPTLRREGAVTRQAWRIEAEGLDVAQIAAPFRAQLVDAGFELLLDCRTRACGGFDFRFATEVLPAPEMHVDLGDFLFVSAQRGEEALSLLVSATSREGYVQLIGVAPSGTARSARPDRGSGPELRDEAPRDPGDLGSRLEAEGRVILSDLSFETGSAQLGDGSFASLRALAEYLDANQGRRVALVGHTDAEGSLEGNITLSRRRAGSVLERLVSDYGVRRAQLDAQGMGYLAPIASNLTPEGREANRRVEVILVSTD